MYSTNQLIQMDRRGFLATLGKLGVSGSALHYMTKGTLAELTDDPSGEVPRLERLEHTNHEDIVENDDPPNREPKYYTISREKWIEVEASNNATDHLKAILRREIKEADDLDSNLNNIKFEVSVEGGSRKVFATYNEVRDRDGNTVRSPDIDPEEIESRLPQSVSGTVKFADKEVTKDFPVEYNERKSIEQSYEGKYRPVPGGCIIEDTDNGGYGTLCTSAYDNDKNESVHVTAAHIFNESSGHDVHQPSFSPINGNYIGQSDKASNITGFDAATITTSTDVEKSLAAPTAGNYDELILGIVGWDKIKDNKDNKDYELSKIGYSTDRKSGHIKTYDKQEKNFWTTANSSDGDSGGPHFDVYPEPYDNWVSIAGVHTWSDGNGNSGGPYIGRVEQEFNLTV